MKHLAERPPWLSLRLRWTIWLLFLLLWSVGLLTPAPAQLARSLLPPEIRLLLAKGLHVVAYAVLAGLTGWVRAPMRLRWLLLAFLFVHAFGTEFGQQFVATRTPSWRDVALNLLGLALGLLLSRRWWQPAAAVTSAPATR